MPKIPSTDFSERSVASFNVGFEENDLFNAGHHAPSIEALATILLVICSSVVLIYYWLEGKLSFNTAWLLIPVLLMVLGLGKSGHAIAGTRTLLWGLLLMAMAGSYWVSGIYTPALYLLPVLTMSAFWLLGRREAGLMFVVVILNVSWQLYIQTYAWLPPISQRPPAYYFLAIVTAMIVALLLGNTAAINLISQYRKIRTINQTLKNNQDRLIREVADRKNAETNLKRSEEQLRLVLEGAEQGFWDWDISFGKVERNKRWAEMLGYTYEEIKQTTQQWSDFIHQDDRERAWRSINDVLEGRAASHKEEYRMLHKDGSIRWILDQASIMQRDEHGMPTRMSGTHTDITERKLLEVQSNENSQRLKTILDNLFAYVALLDTNGVVQEINKATLERGGYCREDIIGQNFYDAPWWNYDSEVRAKLKAAIETAKQGAGSRYDVVVKMGDDLVPIDFQITPIYDSWGQIISLLSTAVDITERKRHEENLNAALVQAHRFQQALDHIPAFVYMKDRQRRYVFANKTTLELFGCNLEQLIGSEDSRFFPPETAMHIQRIDTRVLEYGEDTAEEVIVNNPNGDRRVFWEVKTPMHDDGNPSEITGLCGISSDISERKQIEQILAQKEEKLRAILDTTNECVKLVGRDGTLISMNRAGLKLIEAVSQDQVIGKSVYDFIVPEDRDLYRVFNERICCGKPGAMQYQIIGLRGTRRWMEAHAVPFLLPGTTETLQLGFTTEITERKQKEQALIESETRMRTLFEATNDAVMVIDENRIIDCNPATLRLFGCESKDIFIHYHPANLSPPHQPCGGDSFTLANQQIAKAIEIGNNHFEWIHKHLDTGVLFTAEVSLNMMRFTDRYLLQAVVRDITERKRFEQDLERQAHFDFLTNVYNRRYFMTLADKELARSKRYNCVLSIFMLDIDFFKNINDTHGHKAGDIALKKLAETCQQTLRQVDIIGRMGGEEFAILLPGTNLAEAEEIAERLRIAIANAEVSTENSLQFHFSVSIGITASTNQHENLDILLNQADRAMYAAKHAGRNRIEVLPLQ